VHVARLAGLPQPIIERAWKILAELERGGTQQALMGAVPRQSDNQLSFFDLASTEPPPPPEPVLPVAPPEHPVIGELRSLDPNGLTPLQALGLLAELKNRL
jgi:DNA mismatch repair protein MutS